MEVIGIIRWLFSIAQGPICDLCYQYPMQKMEFPRRPFSVKPVCNGELTEFYDFRRILKFRSVALEIATGLYINLPDW